MVKNSPIEVTVMNLATGNVEKVTSTLHVAEQLWQELQGDNLGGYSGINRPFWIKRALEAAIQKGFLEGRDASAKAIEALRDESTRVQPGFNALNRGLAAIRALALENKT